MAKATDPTLRQLEEAQARPATDPPTRASGRCHSCRRKRPAVAVSHDDPFCSSKCCRAHYGTSLASDVVEP